MVRTPAIAHQPIAKISERACLAGSLQMLRIGCVLDPVEATDSARVAYDRASRAGRNNADQITF